MSAGGELLVVATPIGNLGDLSPRAAEVLCTVDLVLAEDTRRTGRLLQHVGSHVPQLSLHDHNEAERLAAVLERLAAGQRLALVSDAGTPLVSDPGHRVVAACLDAGFAVTAVPGPSAVLHALVVTGMPTDRFVFEGFLSRRGSTRTRQLQEIATQPRTVVLFLSPHRAAADLSDLATACGDDRPAGLAREMTKLHEEVIRGDLGSLRDRVRDEGIRGEVTLVMAGHVAEPVAATDLAPGALAARVAALEADGVDRKAAIKEVARAVGVGRSRVYDAVISSRSDD